MFKFFKKINIFQKYVDSINICDKCDLKDKAIDRLSSEVSNLKHEIGIHEKEIAYWKKIALNFKKFHQ